MAAGWGMLGRGLKVAVGLAAAGLVAWSFAWVLTRPWRVAQERGGKTEITVMNWSGGGGQREEQIVADAIARFEAAFPHIKVRRINPGDAASFYTKLQTMMAANTPPDVFYMGYERLGGFAREDLILEIEPLIEADRAAGRATLQLDDFFGPTVNCFRFDGAKLGSGPLYGIPKDFTTVGFYYNKTLFRAAGIPEPADDWTWDDFVATARQLHRKLPDVTGAEFVTWPAMIRAYLMTYGLDVVDADIRSRLHEPEVRARLDALRSWRHDETGTLTSGKSQVATGESVFQTGKVGMAGPFGRWVTPTYSTITDFEWDFAPLPRGTQQANIVLTVAWSIARQSRHPREAWELAKFLTSAESQASMAELGLAIPTLRTVAQTPAFLNPGVAPSRDQAYLDQVPGAQVVLWPADARFEARMMNRLDEALKTGNVPLDTAIGRLEREWADLTDSPLARTDFPPTPWGRIAAWILVPAGLAGLLGAVWWWRRRPTPAALREELAGYMMVGPWVVGFAVFMAFPIVVSLLLSFSKWSGVSGIQFAQWVGLRNYAQLLLADEKFRVSLQVTAYYALFAVPLGQLFALGAALLMNHEVKFAGFFRSAWYLPSVFAGVGVAVLWRWVFDGDFGLLNNYVLRPLLAPLGLTPPAWFDEDARWFGPPAFAIMSFWAIGGTMVIYLAGLKGIPRDLYEAAAIDGAGSWKRFANVTLPMLSPVIFFNFIMAVIGSFQVFTQAYVMSGGGPGDDTRFYVLYLYDQAFTFHEMGYASALAWLLMAIILVLTIIVMRGSQRYVYYEALKT